MKIQTEIDYGQLAYRSGHKDLQATQDPRVSVDPSVDYKHRQLNTWLAKPLVEAVLKRDLKRVGKKRGEHKCLSPFTNERSPSFFFNVYSKKWYCFSSGFGGYGVVNLALNAWGISIYGTQAEREEIYSWVIEEVYKLGRSAGCKAPWEKYQLEFDFSQN